MKWATIIRREIAAEPGDTIAKARIAEIITKAERAESGDLFGGTHTHADMQGYEHDLVKEWNAVKGFRHVVVLSPGRKRAVAERFKDEFFRRNWRRALAKAATLPMCLGANDRGWVASLDWFVRPDVCAKIVEGFYDKVGKAVKTSAKEDEHAKGF